MPKVETESFWDRLGVELWPNYCFETQNFDFLGVGTPLGVGHVDLGVWISEGVWMGGHRLSTPPYPAIPVVVWQGMAIGYYFKSPYPGYPYPIREGDGITCWMNLLYKPL